MRTDNRRWSNSEFRFSGVQPSKIDVHMVVDFPCFRLFSKIESLIYSFAPDVGDICLLVSNEAAISYRSMLKLKVRIWNLNETVWKRSLLTINIPYTGSLFLTFGFCLKIWHKFSLKLILDYCLLGEKNACTRGPKGQKGQPGRRGEDGQPGKPKQYKLI